MRKTLLGGASAPVLVAGLLLAGCATPASVTIAPAYADRAPRPAAIAVGVTACRVKVASLVDARRAPETIGVVSGRAVKAPDDRNAWLRSVIGGLAARGVAVQFEDPPGDPAQLTADFTLNTAWVTATEGNKTANVVWRMRAWRADEPPVERDYRGATTRINWANGTAELQAVVDEAVGKALDAMAADLRRTCR